MERGKWVPLGFRGQAHSQYPPGKVPVCSFRAPRHPVSTLQSVSSVILCTLWREDVLICLPAWVCLLSMVSMSFHSFVFCSTQGSHSLHLRDPRDVTWLYATWCTIPCPTRPSSGPGFWLSPLGPFACVLGTSRWQWLASGKRALLSRDVLNVCLLIRWSLSSNWTVVRKYVFHCCYVLIEAVVDCQAWASDNDELISRAV